MKRVFGKGWNLMKQLGSSLQNPTSEYLPIKQLDNRKVKQIHAGYLQTYFLLDDGQIIYLGAEINKQYNEKIMRYYKRFPKLLEAWQKHTRKALGKKWSLTNYTDQPTLLNPDVIDQPNILQFEAQNCNLFYNSNYSVYHLNNQQNNKKFERINFDQPVRNITTRQNKTVFTTSYGGVYESESEQIVPIPSNNISLFSDQFKVVKSAIGLNSTIFLTSENKLYVEREGEPFEQIPLYFGKHESIKDIKSGSNHLLILTDKRVYFLGQNNSKQFPFLNEHLDKIVSPLVVPIQGQAVKIFTNYDRSGILTNKGTIYLFGGKKQFEWQSEQLQIVKHKDISQESEVGLGFGHTVISVG